MAKNDDPNRQWDLILFAVMFSLFSVIALALAFHQTPIDAFGPLLLIVLGLLGIVLVGVRGEIRALRKDLAVTPDREDPKR